MHTTEMMPPHSIATNRIANVYKQLEQSKPLADRLTKDSTSGSTLYSDDPRSTWGFNPFSSLRKPEDKRPGTGSCFAQIMALKYPNVLIKCNKEPEPVCFETYWRKRPQESQHWISISEVYNLLTTCIILNPWTSIAEQADVAPASTEQPEPVTQVNMADFLDPLDFEWTDSDTQAAEAARSFNEHVYADH